MVDSRSELISSAMRYVCELGWTLTYVRGTGDNPKAPLFGGWPDLKPSSEVIEGVLGFYGDAQLGLHLGASGLVDLEGDSPEAEAFLDDLCEDLEFPCWQSRRSKHRLFRRHSSMSYLRIAAQQIEFRTGRHQSVLPPSIIDDVQYRWLVEPFRVKPPPLSDRILKFYAEQSGKPGNCIIRQSREAAPSWPYRDRLDYVLRRFDLMKQAAQAGLRFALWKPDANGNVPCYVPVEVRGDGNTDEVPSGVFNIHNGVLRDFATGANHPFFQVMAALTSQPWQDILATYEIEAGAVTGRPHSRRISYPTQAASDFERRTLEDVRASLGDYYDEQLDRPHQPKTLHIIKGPPGVGKTYGLCKKLGEKLTKAIILTLENKLATRHREIIQAGGGNSVRMPVIGESACPSPDEYQTMSRRGFRPSQSHPCRSCPIGVNRCDYLLGFSSLASADQLCCAAIYHTHDDFYESHGNQNRPVVIFDENVLDLILSPVSANLAQWRAFGRMLGDYDPRLENPGTVPIHRLIEWFGQIESDFAKPVGGQEQPPKFKVFSLPNDLRVPGISKSEPLEEWLNLSAFRSENRRVQNLYSAAVYLLSEPTSHVMLERIRKSEDQEIINIRFRRKHSLPEDKEVFILDATANEELIRAVAPGWVIKVWECPPIEQKGQVIQVMDYDVSRNRIRKEVDAHTDLNPAWLVQVLDHILQKHGPAYLISFKDVVTDAKPEMDLIGKLRHSDRINGVRNYPCRGHTLDSETLIVVGTPYKDEASIWELAMAIWGTDGLPTSKYTRRERENDWFVSRNMEYEEEHLRPIHDFIVSSDLVQAIGRVRPLQNDSTVFVISNAPISDWRVQQFTASELFDMRVPLRADAADVYTRYVETANSLLRKGRNISNALVCSVMELPKRTGQTYWSLFKRYVAKDVQEESGGNLRLRQAENMFEGVLILE